MDTQGKKYPRTKGYIAGYNEAADTLSINWLYMRLEAAQALRNGTQPDNGALNNVQPDCEEARYAPFN